MVEYSKAIVMDIGSCLTKVGFAGEEEPKLIIPTLVGAPRKGLVKKKAK